MSFDSWKAAVGASWSRLLLYPGGLTALALALLLALLWRLVAPGTPQVPASGAAALASARAAGGAGVARRRLAPDLLALIALAAPLLALSALPLPGATELRVPLDLPSLLLLLELPTLAAVLAALRSREAVRYEAAVAQLSGLLTAAPVLALAFSAWATVSRILTVHLLPERSVEQLIIAVCWVLALAPLLHLGPWHPAPSGSLALRLALQLRRAAHIGLATLPWLTRWPEELWDALELSLLREQGLFFATALLLALPLLVFDRLARGRSMRRWGAFYFLPAAILLGLIVWQGVNVLAERLR